MPPKTKRHLVGGLEKWQKFGKTDVHMPRKVILLSVIAGFLDSLEMKNPPRLMKMEVDMDENGPRQTQKSHGFNLPTTSKTEPQVEVHDATLFSPHLKPVAKLIFRSRFLDHTLLSREVWR